MESIVHCVKKDSSNPYVVLVHGGPGAVGSLHQMAERLSMKYNVLEYIQTKYTIEELKQELLSQIRSFTDVPVCLIGHSWGAWLSIMFEVEHPDMVSKLILVGCPPFDEKYVPAILDNRLGRLDQKERTRFIELLSSIEVSVSDALTKELEHFAELTDNYCLLDNSASGEMNMKMYESVWGEASTMRHEGVLMDILSKISCPVVLVHGRMDPHPLEGVAEPMKEAHVQFVQNVLDRCGHSPFNEKFASEAFYCILDKFIG